MLNERARESDIEAKSVLNRLEHVTLRDVTRSSQIYYDPDPTTSVIQEDIQQVELNNAIEGDVLGDLSPWLLRIELSDKELDHRGFTMEQIEDSITAYFSSELQLICSDDNDVGHRIIRIRVRKPPRDEHDVRVHFHIFAPTTCLQSDYARWCASVLPNYISLAVGWWLVVGGWRLVVGGWWMVAGSWRL